MNDALETGTAGVPDGAVRLFYQYGASTIQVFARELGTAGAWTTFGAEQPADTQLTSQQVKALAATNIELVAAPGSGLAVIPTRVHYFLDRDAAYDDAAADGDLVVAYGVTQTALITTEADTFIDAASDAARVSYATGTITPEANTALVLDNDGAEFTGDAGNANTLSVRVDYKIVPMAAFS